MVDSKGLFGVSFSSVDDSSSFVSDSKYAFVEECKVVLPEMKEIGDRVVLFVVKASTRAPFSRFMAAKTSKSERFQTIFCIILVNFVASDIVDDVLEFLAVF